VPAAPGPVQQPEDWKGHDDPLVGQNKPIDPNDKTWGIKGTWDFNKPPKVTGIYGDLPKVGPVNPGGDQAEYPKDKDDTPDGGGPKFGGPPPGSTPPGPGWQWDPILQGWKKYKDADAGVPPPPPRPDPQADPRGPGDYEVPGGDSAPA
jgi:hypothetical protein